MIALQGYNQDITVDTGATLRLTARCCRGLGGDRHPLLFSLLALLRPAVAGALGHVRAAFLAAGVSAKAAWSKQPHREARGNETTRQQEQQKGTPPTAGWEGRGCLSQKRKYLLYCTV